MQGNWVERLGERARQEPERIALRSLADAWEGSRFLTYRDLDRQARAAAAALTRLAPMGERAMLLLPNGLHYAVGFLGCLYAGLIAVPAFPPDRQHRTHCERLIGILRDATPRILLTTEQHEDACRSLVERLETPIAPHVVRVRTS